MSGPTEGNLNSTTPAAPAGKTNVVFQADAPFIDPATGLLERDISAYMPLLVGDTGSGGASGAVPAPGAGDAAAGKFLSASGGFAVPIGGGAGSPPFTNMLAPTSVTPPVVASLTWANQGTAAAAANAGGAVYFSDGPGSGSDNIRMLYKSAPATPWTFTVGIVPGTGFSSYDLAGIAMRQSSTGKIIFLQVGTNNSGGSLITVAKFSNYTTFSASYVAYNTILFSPTWWLRVSSDGTNFTWSVSIDGQNFKTITTKAVTDYFTGNPDQVGIAVDPISGAYVTDALFVHWAGV